jgi:DHA2 family multidrug resistance protein
VSARQKATALFNLSRLYGKGPHALPCRRSRHGFDCQTGLAALNDMITGWAALVGVIDQFKVMLIAMLSPLVLFLRKA